MTSGQTLTGTIQWLNRVNLTFGTDTPSWIADQNDANDRSLLIPGDVNRNDIINATDLALINQNITIGNSIYAPGDFNQDGYVTSADQAILLKEAGKNGRRRNFAGSQDNTGVGPSDEAFRKAQ